MVHQVLTDTLEIMDDLDAVRAEQLGGAYPRNLQQLWRLQSPSTQDDLPVSAHEVLMATPIEGDPGRGLAVELDLGHERFGHDVEIRPLSVRPDVAQRGR